jgi:sigma-E factor negative regulatory protein RseA
MNEELSALVDGESSELERERALRALRNDPAMKATWERYHLVSTAIRRELHMMVSPSVADRVQARLQDEQPERIGVWTRTPRLFKAAAGLAIAASVAVVAVLNLAPIQSSITGPLAKSSPTQKPASSVADARPTPSEQQRALNPYLVRHGEVAPAAGMSSMLSHVRVVGYDNNSSIESKNGE